MKAFFRFSIIIFIFNHFINITYAGNFENKTGKITGYVFDANSNKPIEYATVSVYKLPDTVLVSGCITDASGKFEIENLLYDNYFVSFQFLGYEKKIIENVTINSKIHELENIFLIELVNELETVTISSQKNLVEQKIDKKVINVSQDLSSIGGTAADVLVNNALVQTNSDGDVLLRNSSSFIVLIDGKPSPFAGAEALNQIQSSEIERIELITNPSAKYNAEGVTGIINIITKKQRFKGISGIVNASYSSNNAYSGDFILNYKNEKLNFFVGTDYKKQVTNVSFDIDRTYTFTDTLYYRDELIKQTIIRQNPAVKFGLDYQINSNTNISFTNTSGTGSNLDKTKSVHI
ncbi:MAG: carboxypeptidase regulatory-like domain-containing protein [Weeksellaceae bacterium]|jgi:hypothetical protein|nr:carboxypeptidase regulatory-like domain-containing protein [Weeksellaceae bacterium]